jgi:hypothetical protein
MAKIAAPTSSKQVNTRIVSQPSVVILSTLPIGTNSADAHQVVASLKERHSLVENTGNLNAG